MNPFREPVLFPIKPRVTLIAIAAVASLIVGVVLGRCTVTEEEPSSEDEACARACDMTGQKMDRRTAGVCGAVGGCFCTTP